MAEFILNSDPLEFQNTRQSTKITFLQQEVVQLQDHVKDLEQVVRINKEALKIATSQQFQMISKRGSQNDTTGSTMDSAISQNYSKNLQQLVEQLQEENLKLLEIVQKVKEERNIAQSRALISEQICEEAQRREIEAQSEFEEKIYDLRKMLQDKEFAVQELEKVKPVFEQDGVVIKYREVLNPTEQTLKLCNEIDSLNGMLAKVSKNLNKVQIEKQNLIKNNFDLTTELSKIRAMFSNPLNVPSKYRNIKKLTESEVFLEIWNNKTNLNKSTGDDAEPFAQHPVEIQDDNSLLCPSPLPDKVSHVHSGQKKSPVPKLDLSGAKKIQENIVNKLNSSSQPKASQADPKLLEKIKQLEKELESLRKRLSVELINNRLLSDEISSIERAKKDILAINEILVKSNKKYEERLQKAIQSMEYYKELYTSQFEQPIKTYITPSKTTSTILPNSKSPNEKQELNADKLIEDEKDVSDREGRQVNVSVLEEQPQKGLQIETSNANEANNIFKFTKEQCKTFLLNLARELYLNTNISKSSAAKNILRNFDIGKNIPAREHVLQLQRSVSNPLDYVSERKKLVFEPETNNGKKAKKLRKQKKNTSMLDLDEDETKNQRHSFVLGDLKFNDSTEKFDSPLKNDGPFFGYTQNEMISFNVDEDEFNKQKVVDVSFISNNEILDQIKHH